jgi:hypothetical protein
MVRSLESGPAPLGTGTASDTGSLLVYPTTFHPGTTSIDDAKVVSVRAGDDVESVDLSLRPVRTWRVSGTVRKRDGTAGSQLALHLVPADAGAWTMPLPVSRTVSDASGAFTFLGVPPGAYRVELLKAPARADFGEAGFVAIGMGPDGVVSVSTDADDRRSPPAPDPSADEMWWGSTTVVVGETDASGVLVELAPGARISGRIVVPDVPAGGGRQPRLGYDVMLQRADGREVAITMGPDGRAGLGNGATEDGFAFKTRPLPPGRYLLRLNNVAVKAAMAGGRNIADVPLDLGTTDVTGVEVTLLEPGASVSGVVRTGSGSPPAGLAVVAFPVDRAGWSDFGATPLRIRTAAMDANGRYEITGLAAGEYFVATIDHAIPADAVHPALLAALSRQALRVSVGENATRSLDIVVR